MRKKILRSTIIALCSISIILLGSSYLAVRGTWKGKGFTFKAHHADIFTYRRNRKTRKIKNFHRSSSVFQLIADKGFYISKKSYIVVRNKKNFFKGYGGNKKSNYRRSYSLSAPGHLPMVRLVVYLQNKKTGDKFTVNKKFRLTGKFPKTSKLTIKEIK